MQAINVSIQCVHQQQLQFLQSNEVSTYGIFQFQSYLNIILETVDKGILFKVHFVLYRNKLSKFEAESSGTYWSHDPQPIFINSISIF